MRQMRRHQGKARGINPRTPLLGLLAAIALTLPAAASAHLERPSYWPDPARTPR